MHCTYLLIYVGDLYVMINKWYLFYYTKIIIMPHVRINKMVYETSMSSRVEY